MSKVILSMLGLTTEREEDERIVRHAEEVERLQTLQRKQRDEILHLQSCIDNQVEQIDRLTGEVSKYRAASERQAHTICAIENALARNTEPGN